MTKKVGDGRHYKDEIDHKRHIGFLRARSQARYRGEEWTMTLEQWFEIWTRELWLQRGKRPECLVMIRSQIDQPWSYDNCVLVTRYQQLCRGKNMLRYQGQFKDLKV